MKKIEITIKQAEQFNMMLSALRTIKSYQSPGAIKKDRGKDWGLDAEEAIEMAYENIQATAKNSCRNIKPIVI